MTASTPSRGAVCRAPSLPSLLVMLVFDWLLIGTGMLAGALAWLYKASGTTSLLSDAGNIARTVISSFTSNGIFADSCEPAGCADNAVQPKGTMIRGLGYLAAITTIQADKTAIQTALSKSVTAMFLTCDSGYNCGINWASGGTGQSDFHDQLDSMELVTAYAEAGTGINPATFSAPAAASTTTSPRNAAVGGPIPVVCSGLVWLATVLLA